MLTSKIPIWLIHIVVWFPLQPYHKGKTQAQKKIFKKMLTSTQKCVKIKLVQEKNTWTQGKG
jgi:hypothetical protein